MSQENSELLLQSFSSVFEGFAFMFVEQEPDLEAPVPGACQQALIEFKSRDIQGSLEVIAPEDLCTELAENILGTETDDLPEDAGENALKEILNVSCGSLLAGKFGTEEVFDLSIPETRTISQEQWNTRCDSREYELFWIDESPMLARFIFSNRPG